MDNAPHLLGEAVSGERVAARGHMVGSAMVAVAAGNYIAEQPLFDNQAVNDKDACASDELLAAHKKMSVIAGLQSERLSNFADLERQNLSKNRVKILNKWRSYMREIKLEELLASIDIISSTHYRELDHQVHKLKNVNNDIDKLNEQFQKAERSHFRGTSQLNQIHRERMKELQAEFERDLEILKTEFHREKASILSYHKEQREMTENVNAEIERREFKEQHELRQLHETEREELRNKNLEDLNVLKISLETEIEEYEKQFDETHDRYIESTEDKSREFSELKQKDEKLSLEIENLMKRIELLQQQLSFWKKKIAQNDKECNDKISMLKKNKLQLMQQYRALKVKMTKFRKAQNDRLSNIVTAARETNAKNSEILEMGQRILKYSQIAQKLQTEKETVLPFGTQQPTANQIPAVMQDEDSALVENMKHFLKKYNFALMDMTVFQETRKTLVAENKKLRSALKAYLKGITVSDTTIKQPNTLFVVNHNTQFVRNETAPSNEHDPAGIIGKARKPIMEGNQIINAYQTQLNTQHTAHVAPL